MRRLLPLAALLLAPAAHAQILSVYGTFAPVRVTGVGSQSPYWADGFGLGATLGVVPIGPVRLGFDVRGSSKPGSPGADLILAGPRLSVHLPVIRLRPYLEATGGYLHTRTVFQESPGTGSTATRSFAAYEIIGGVDYPLIHFVDLRLVEIGGGQGFSSSGNASLLTVSTGLVLHF